MAVVDGDSFKPFKAKNGKRFQTLVMGSKSGDEIIEDAQDANSMWTWILRIVGIFLVVSALKMIFGFLSMILKVVPFLSSIMGFGIGIICWVIGVAWSLIVIAIAWIFYRPLLGISYSLSQASWYGYSPSRVLRAWNWHTLILPLRAALWVCIYSTAARSRMCRRHR